MRILKTSALIFSLFSVALAFGPTQYGRAGLIPRDRIQLAGVEDAEVEVGISIPTPTEREYQKELERRQSNRGVDILPPKRSVSVESNVKSETMVAPATREHD